jgi:CRP/FNR family transcriptional regulator, cyclic AMP receptor protein
MNIKAFTELFPIFSSANPKTLEFLLSTAMDNEYGSDKTIILEDSWGNAIYFIVSGWLKVRRLLSDSSMTLAILGKGDFFGEMAILDESPRSTDVVSLCNVRLLSIPATEFLEALSKDHNLQHKLLQLMATRIRYVNVRFQIRNHPPAIKLVRLLVSLAENYGIRNGQIIEIFQIPSQDLADVADITVEEAQKILEKLVKNEWIDIQPKTKTLRLINFKQLVNLANKI